MFSFFKKKNKTLKSICAGSVINIEDLPDEAFASKLIGDGVGVKLREDIIKSPINGEIKAIFETKHALMIEGDGGEEILIHVGFNTVNLKGEGFEAIKTVGERVKIGDPILIVDREFIEENGYSTDTAILIANMDKFSIKSKLLNGEKIDLDSDIFEYKLQA